MAFSSSQIKHFHTSQRRQHSLRPLVGYCKYRTELRVGQVHHHHHYYCSEDVTHSPSLAMGVFSTQPHWPPLSPYLNAITQFYQSFKIVVGRRADSSLDGGWNGGVMVGWLESSAVLDCKRGQLVLLTRDQYCPPSGWSQAAGSDRGPCGVIGSGGAASRLPTPPSVLSQLSDVIPLHCCHPRRLVVLSLSPSPRFHANVHLADECRRY